MSFVIALQVTGYDKSKMENGKWKMENAVGVLDPKDHNWVGATSSVV
jgi:hypothetical protein